jgi:uncharacterized cupin superfamily protein
MTEPFNVYDGELEVDPPEPPGYCRRYKELAPLLGGELLSVNAFELDPDEVAFPYHYEYAEEWLIVLSGRPVLRDPEGEHQLETGDVVCFPAGPAGAHKVYNRGAEPLRIVMLSPSGEPSVAVYPDSDKIGVWPGTPGDRVILHRRDGAVDYYDGEKASS